MARETLQHAPPPARNGQAETNQIERGRQALSELPQDVADAIRAHVEADANKRNEEGLRRLHENFEQSIAYSKRDKEMVSIVHEAILEQWKAEYEKMCSKYADALVRLTDAKMSQGKGPGVKKDRTEKRHQQIDSAMDNDIKEPEDILAFLIREKPDLVRVKKGKSQFISARHMMRLYKESSPERRARLQ